jgi:hypothetical protein
VSGGKAKSSGELDDEETTGENTPFLIPLKLVQKFQIS